MHVGVTYRVVIHDRKRNADIEVASFHKYDAAEKYMCELARAGALGFERIVLIKE